MTSLWKWKGTGNKEIRKRKPSSQMSLTASFLERWKGTEVAKVGKSLFFKLGVYNFG